MTAMPELRLTVPPEARDRRLDRWLAEDLKLLSRSQLQARGLEAKLGQKALKLGTKLRGGEELLLTWAEPENPEWGAEPVDLDILHEDETCWVVNKARGQVVHPAHGHWHGTVVQGLLYRHQALAEAFAQTPLRPGVVHRLDKDTTGVLIAAKTPEAYEALARQFRDRSTRKIYWALVKGQPPQKQGVLDAPLARDPRNRQKWAVVPGGKPSRTRYKVVVSAGGLSLLKLRPLTGRTHQLRVHLAYLGCPILGDPLYAKADPKRPAPLMLHARSLRIRLPGQGGGQAWGGPGFLEPARLRIGVRSVTAGARTGARLWAGFRRRLSALRNPSAEGSKPPGILRCKGGTCVRCGCGSGGRSAERPPPHRAGNTIGLAGLL